MAKKTKKNKKTKDKKKKRSIWDILSTASVASIALMVVLVAVMVIGIGGATSGRQGVTGMITAEDAKQKASNMIKGSLTPGTEVTINKVTEDSGLYKLDISIKAQGKTQELTSYMTKDGKYFFPQGMKVEDLTNQTQ